MLTPAHHVLGAAHMCEFPSLDRCAAYVAARMAVIAVQRVAAPWPDDLAQRARRGALDAMQLTAEATSHDHASAGRRHCLREAIACILGVAAAIDAVRAAGFCGDELVEVQRLAGRTVALLGMFLHASSAAIPEPGPLEATSARRPTVAAGPRSRPRAPRP